MPEDSPTDPPIEASDILVVDDNQDAADSLVRLLLDRGMRASVAYDGEEAIAAAQRTRPDAMVLDLGMPGVNGLDVARWVRQQAWGQAVRLVAVSGWGQAEDREATTAAGFDAHLVKPVGVDDVFMALRPPPAS